MNAIIKDKTKFLDVIVIIVAIILPILSNYLLYDNGPDILNYLGIKISSSAFEIIFNLIECIFALLVVKLFLPFSPSEKLKIQMNAFVRVFSIACLFLLMSKFLSKLGYISYQFFFHDQRPLEILRLPLNPIVASSPKTFLFAAAVTTPIFEELWFRHVLYSKLNRLIGEWLAVFLIAIIFTLYHFPNYLSSLVISKFFFLTAPSIFITGLALGIIRAKFGILYSIIIHSLVNLYESSEFYPPLSFFLVCCVPIGAYFLWLESKKSNTSFIKENIS